MADASLKEQIVSRLDTLTAEQQRLVLNYVAGLGKPQGKPGHLLVERLRDLHADPADVDEMARAIEEEHGRIDEDGWDISL